MHANLNTTLFYDLVLLIECSNWKSTPSLNTMQKSRSPGWSHDPGLKLFWNGVPDRIILFWYKVQQSPLTLDKVTYRRVDEISKNRIIFYTSGMSPFC